MAPPTLVCTSSLIIQCENDKAKRRLVRAISLSNCRCQMWPLSSWHQMVFSRFEYKACDMSFCLFSKRWHLLRAGSGFWYLEIILTHLPPPQPSTLAYWGRGTTVITEICPDSPLSFPIQKHRLQRESHQNLWVLADNYPNWNGEWNLISKPFSVN